MAPERVLFGENLKKRVDKEKWYGTMEEKEVSYEAQMSLLNSVDPHDAIYLLDVLGRRGDE